MSEEDFKINTRLEVEDKVNEEEELSFPYRIDWYQTDIYVVVMVFRGSARSEDKYNVDFTDNSMQITASTPNGETIVKLINLEQPIDSTRSYFAVYPLNVEIKLRKLSPGQWKHYEALTDMKMNEGKGKTKNWDNLVKNFEEEKLEGEACLNQFFQNIYCDGSDEVKKAMIKSFTESGGTELSTNWNEVSKDKVTVKPPEGMEWKKWDS